MERDQTASDYFPAKIGFQKCSLAGGFSPDYCIFKSVNNGGEFLTKDYVILHFNIFCWTLTGRRSEHMRLFPSWNRISEVISVWWIQSRLWTLPYCWPRVNPNWNKVSLYIYLSLNLKFLKVKSTKTNHSDRSHDFVCIFYYYSLEIYFFKLVFYIFFSIKKSKYIISCSTSQSLFVISAKCHR